MKNEYICLESSDGANRHYSSNFDKVLSKVDEMIHYPSGISYKILGYADSSEEAVRILYPTVEEEKVAIANYIHGIAMKIYSTEGDLYEVG